jgi:glutamate 5-kinase
MQAEREQLKQAKRIVIKVGSSTLTRDGKLRTRKFTDIARDVSALLESGCEVVLVSSGAIAIGSHKLGWTGPRRSIPELQAAAAVGQIGLVDLYQKRFAKHGRTTAQVLLTRSGLENRERFLNARHTLLTLLELGVVPVVNENDTVATDEIRFGDNDNLSANIASLVDADLLIILTDVEGLYAEPPVPGRKAPPLIDLVPRITPEIEAAAQGSGSAFGRGGMTTKLEAADTAAKAGAATVLCSGARSEVLQKVVAGESIGTLFLPGEKMTSRKHWLAYTNRTRGELVLDAGACKAVRERGRSLLPAGVVEVRGRFSMGDSVLCVDEQGAELARGLVAYGAKDVARIKGLGTGEIDRVLGFTNGDEVIHRDDLVLLED